MIELTDEQFRAMANPGLTPPRLVDPRTNQTLVLLPADEYERLTENPRTGTTTALDAGGTSRPRVGDGRACGVAGRGQVREVGMNLSRGRSIGLALSGIAGAQLARAAAAEADDQGDGATSVSWEGLGTKTKILGRLGRPLGDLLRVEGTTVHSNYIRDKGEHAEFLLRVTSVEGREIEEPTVLRLRFFPFPGYRRRHPRLHEAVARRLRGREPHRRSQCGDGAHPRSRGHGARDAGVALLDALPGAGKPRRATEAAPDCASAATALMRTARASRRDGRSHVDKHSPPP